MIRVYDGAGQCDRDARARGRVQRAEALLVTARHEPEAEPGVDKFGCAWTLCSTRSGYGWPQRSQLQPGVPPLARCVTLVPPTFWNLGLGDPLSSCNKRIVFISYSFFAWQIRIPGAIARLHADWLLLCETRLDLNQPRSSETSPRRRA